MRVLTRLATLLVALLAGELGLVALMPLALIAPVWLTVPLALAVGALLAALAAGWSATWLGGATRTRLAATVALVEATALVAAALGLALLRGALDGPLAGPILVAGAVLALAATAAAWGARRSAEGPNGDRALTLRLLALAGVGVPGVVLLAGLAGLLAA